MSATKKRNFALCYRRLICDLPFIDYHDSTLGNKKDGCTMGSCIWLICANDSYMIERWSSLQRENHKVRIIMKHTFGREILPYKALLDFPIANLLRAIMKHKQVRSTSRKDCAPLYDQKRLKKQPYREQLLLELFLIRD